MHAHQNSSDPVATKPLAGTERVFLFIAPAPAKSWAGIVCKIAPLLVIGPLSGEPLTNYNCSATSRVPAERPGHGLLESRLAHTALRLVCSAFDRSRL